MRGLIVLGFAGISALAGFALGGWEVYHQRYVAHSLYRNGYIVLSGDALRAAMYGALGIFVVLLVAILVRRLGRGRVKSPTLLAFSLFASVAVVARVGWSLNRYRLRDLWKERSGHFGIDLPQALFDGRAIGLNGATLAGGALLCVLVYFSLRWLVPRLSVSRRSPLLRVSVALAATGYLSLGAIHLAGRLFLHGAPAGRPNVVFISLDTLRADHLGCYGCDRSTSPAIDAFARRCVVFENAFSQAPTTLRSHASFLASRYPSVNRASMTGSKVPRRRVLCAELFREAGYRTCGIVDATFLTDRYGLAQGYDEFVGWGRRARNIVPWALRWLERCEDDPFFLFIHIYDIHSPYAREPEYQQMFLDFEYDGEIRPEGSLLGRYQRMKCRGEDPGFAIDDRDARYLNALYAGGVRYTDDRLADLLRLLSEDRFLENTIVLLTADHGEEFMEHGTVLHGELYRTVTHVPLLLRLPGGERGGMRIAHPVGLIDVVPTLLDLSGLHSPVHLSGTSLAPLWLGEEERFPPVVFSEFDEMGDQVAAADGSYHLVIHRKTNRQELFRYLDDSLEQNDLLALEREMADSLGEHIARWREEMAREIDAEADFSEVEADVDEELLEYLRGLGYVE